METATTKKKIRKKIATSLGDALQQLHIQNSSKKVKKLIEKTSRQIAVKVLKELKKNRKQEKPTKKKSKVFEK